MSYLKVWKENTDNSLSYKGVLLGIVSDRGTTSLVVVTPHGGVIHVDSTKAVVEYPAEVGPKD